MSKIFYYELIERKCFLIFTFATYELEQCMNCYFVFNVT